MTNRAEELITQLEAEIFKRDARIAELEAHCVRLGQGGAERYWEGRWRDADAQIGDLVAHIERQDDAYALLSLDAGRKMEEIETDRDRIKTIADNYSALNMDAQAELAALKAHKPDAWLPMDTAPKDGTLIRLLVEFTENAIDDGEDPAPTIGQNNLDNDEEDRWQFVGWCWTHDHFTDGKGMPIGWLPMLAAAPSAQQKEG